MEIKSLGKIINGQDGAIFNGYLFRLDEKGKCTVYRIADLSENSSPIAQFVLDKAEKIVPHCNSVMFGNEHYCAEDEFPLLYSNIYNNYASSDNKLKGTTCVYRLERENDTFRTTLVQIIKIAFTDDDLWKSANINDVRPFGNFVIDNINSLYYAFTMRDEDKTTRYFSFKLPKLNDGVFDDALGVKIVTLKKDDIIDFFDCEYHNFIQGASMNNGLIYSLEGFDASIPPALRIINPIKKEQEAVYYFADLGFASEPEFIDFENGNCYYSDDPGNTYALIF